jgi:hypothetical protein
MYVLRGVSRWLAVFCMLGLAASFTGCSKKSPSDSGGKSPDAKTTEVGTGHNGGGPRQTIDNDGKSPVKAKSPTQPKSNGGDPTPARTDDSGSGLKSKIRGPKLGSGR